jgi:hypothetical protein
MYACMARVTRFGENKYSIKIQSHFKKNNLNYNETSPEFIAGDGKTNKTTTKN